MSRQTKQLGGWGLIFALAGSILGSVIHFAGLLTLIGWIMTVIAYIKASDEYREPQIKSNTVKAVTVGIITFLIFIVAGGTMSMRMMSAMEDGGMTFSRTGFFLMLLAWISAIIASWFWYKANIHMTERSGVGYFKIGGLLMFVGTILTVIVIGGLVSLVGEILLIIAFFSVPERTGELQTA